jgi:hypothetical protein
LTEFTQPDRRHINNVARVLHPGWRDPALVLNGLGTSRPGRGPAGRRIQPVGSTWVVQVAPLMSVNASV